MRVASIVMAVLFAVGAIVQWNDPDPLLWIVAYLIGMGLSLAAGLGRALAVPSLLAALVFGLAFLVSSPSLLGAPGEAFTSFEMRATEHEEPREAVGLALLAIWNAALGYWALRRTQGRGEPPSS